ncbi:SusC/RagA family TonB-linked outer membrane protein [Pedobacter sp. FW305-3-2-15-E-R2A2]|uniref:SusC/RagA family TonB-linked outer membrane protein n=1 Tax=Pedobacter sp. FW305-3-2-15-E-R2A2 TaxID=3140251 RepID=UPI00313FFE24
MKLVIIILIASLMQVSAVGFAQKVSLNEKNAMLESTFKKIRLQTGYDFVYDSKLIDFNKKVSLEIRNMDLENALSLILDGQNLSFEIRDKVIVLAKKSPSLLKKIISEFTAQDINGIVLDEKGLPLPGANVKLKGQDRSVKSNGRGAFILQGVVPGEVLQVSYVGYENFEVTLTEELLRKGVLGINLKPTAASLAEVSIVNTGYQKLSREKITGSVTTVGSAELEKRNSTNIMQNLEGLIPGLVQTRLRTTIRGVSTLDDSMRGILYVVDGLPIEGGINQINPYDVESVSVLKDAAAAAIYGARASNGVIVITTKRAKEVGKTVVEVSGNVSITEKPDYSYQNWMSPAQQVDYESNYYKWWFNGGGNGGATVDDPIGDFESRISTSNFITPIAYAYYQQKKGTINQAQVDEVLNNLKKNDFLAQYKDNAIQTGLTQQYNFALRTNNGKNQNSLVVNYTTFNNGGNNNTTGGVTTGSNLALINSFNKTLNLFYKGTYNVGKWLDLDYGINSIIGKIRTHNSEWANDPSNVPAYYKLLNDDGSRAYYYTSRFNGYNEINKERNPALASFMFNHLDELERDFNTNSTLNTRYYVNLNIKPFQGFTISPMFQVEDGRSTSSTYSEPESYTMRIIQNAYTTRTGTAGNYVYDNLLPQGGKLGTSQLRGTNYTARVQANYNKTFGKHGVIALIGSEFRQTLVHTGTRGILLGYEDQLQTGTNMVNYESLYAINKGAIWDVNYPTRQYHFNQISFDQISNSTSSINPDETKHRYGSGYANITYTYDHKYNIFGSARKDYADLFGGDEKYRGRPLWSAGASWIASKEGFLKDIKAINYLKLRASYGFTGNTRNVTAFLAATTSTNPITQLPNANVSNPPNPQLRWEKTATINIGTDFSLLENRLRGAIDGYRRVGTDLFAFKRMDPSEGFTEMTINNASMVNKGLELSLAYDWFRPEIRDGFGWSSNVTGSLNNNKVTSVDELTKDPFTLAAGGSFKVGYPVASIFAFRFAGLSATGVPQFFNAAGQPTTGTLGPSDADAIAYMGNEDPKYNLSVNNDFSYKGFTLSVFAIYQGGNYFRARQVPIGYPGPGYNQTPSYVLDGWSPTNTNTDVPASGQFYQVPLNNQYYLSDNLVRRADFFKIRNIVLGYAIPREMASKIKASNLRLRLQIDNPNIAWYKQKDIRIDAETAGARIPTSFVLGLNANF